MKCDTMSVVIDDVTITISFDGDPIGRVRGYKVTIDFPCGESYCNQDFVSHVPGATLRDGLSGFVALLGAAGLHVLGVIPEDHSSAFPGEVSLWAANSIQAIERCLSSLDTPVLG